jgi:hypothetical protein
MSKTITGKRIKIELEFYWRGKRKIPSVNFTEGKRDQGIPFTGHTDIKGTPKGDAFGAFNKAAHDFCKQLVDSGELG